MAGIDLVHVPYKGAAPTAAALLAGEVSIAFNVILLPLPHVHAGKLSGLAVASAKRSPLAPDIPTLAELGYPIDIDTWYGLVAPAGTPKEVVAKLNAETLRILNLPELRERTRSQGIELARYAVLAGRNLNSARIATLEAEGLVEARDGRLRVTAGGFAVLDAIVADLAA